MRSHYCGALRAADAGTEVALCGWVAARREHGEHLAFVDLRDHTGVVQCVVDGAHDLRSEYVLRITGQVQGVFYRAWAVEQARALGLKGWIRNRGDGSVEAVAFGVPEAVDQFIALCREGSPSAQVDRVEVEAADGEPPEDFRTVRTT